MMNGLVDRQLQMNNVIDGELKVPRIATHIIALFPHDIGQECSR